MDLPLPQYRSLGQMIQDQINQGLEMQAKQAQIKNALIKNKYAEPMAQEALKESQSMNAFNQEMNPLKIQQAQINNKFLEPEALARLASQAASTNRSNALLPYDIEEAKGRPDLQRAQIENYKALASNRSDNTSGLGVGGKAKYEFKKQLAFENPDWTPQQVDQAASAYISGLDTLPSGEKLPPLTGLGQSSLAQLLSYNAPAAVKNNAASMAITADEFSNIPIDSIAKFAGPLGKMDYAAEKLKMITNPNSVSPEFREYKKYQDEISILAMDTLRKGFGTSVVPDYVYQTLGKALNPQSTWWNDPKQVSIDLKELQKWVNKNSENLNKQVRGGVTAKLGGEESSKDTMTWNPQTRRLE